MMVYEPYKDPAFHGFVPLDTAHNLHPHSHIHKPRQPLSHSVPHLRLHRSLSLDDITASITAMTRADPIFEDLWRPSPVHSPTATSPLQSPGIKTPHPLEESLLPLSPDELRRRLALPETLNFDKRDKRTSTGHIFSAPLPVHTEPTSPAAGYFTYPANNSPEEHQHHFERVKSLDNDKLDKVTTRPKKPKRAQTAAMAAPGGVNGTERAKLPLPRNLLFIDNQLTPNTDLTADPMARAGAALGSEPPSAGSDTPEGGLTPTGEIPPSQAPVPQPTRVGKIGDFEASLPKVNAEPSEYYGGQQVASRARTFSTAGTAGYSRGRPLQMDGEAIGRNRRLSHDEISASAPRRFLVDVEETMRIVLEQEDTDANFQISIYDSGPKLISLGTASSNQHKSFDIRGTYMLSNLLQELALARDYGRKRIVLDEARLAENPVDRLSRMIKNSFWNALTRRIDAEGLEVACADPKNRSRHSKSRIYVPAGEDDQLEYYKKISADKPNLNLEVIQLPPKCDDPAYVKSLNEEPGILALAVERKVDPKTGEKKLEPLPFIVPGARFNEMYYWDSYFMALGLLVDDRIDLAMSVVENFIFQIKHYNKVLNGNRTYYLCRSQPPFLTDLAVQIFNQHHDRETLKPWLKRAIQAAIKEYHCYWMQEPSLDIKSGLSRYRPVGQGIPPETEASHFTHILEPYAKKLGISVNDYIEGYNERKILEPELDEYFVHDRGVRESGHDTSYRLDRRCADLATVDLNSLLYKYESDIYMAIEQFFGGELDMEDEFDLSPWPITAENFAEGAKRESSTSRTQKAEEWRVRMETRKATMNELCWNEGRGMFFDWDTKAGKQARYESVTCMWPLWAGHASEDQAMKMVNMALPKFEVAGGLVSGTEESRGIISIDRPNRQWDYPFSWPPHQIMTWVGLERYGHDTHAARLAYRWIYMMTLSFVDFNGIVPEKFDAVELSHMVDAEYGNQGTDFRYVPREGFGWMNAAYQVGLQFLSIGMRRAVAACVPPWVFFNLPAPDFPSARRRRAEREKQEEDAAAHGHGGQPKKQVHHEPPSLEQAIANLKIDLGATKA